MATPQPTPFVRFSSELLEAVIASPMPAAHKEIVLGVVRLTFGDYGKRDARIPQRKLQQLTGRAKSTVADALSELCREHVLLRLEPPVGSRAARLAIQVNYEAWGKFTPTNAGEIADRYRSAGPQTYRPALPKEYRQSDPRYVDTRKDTRSYQSDSIHDIPDIHVPEGVLR